MTEMRRYISGAVQANRRGMLFLTALGFLTDPDVDARRIYGVQAIAGYDFGTEDRARFTRRP